MNVSKKNLIIIFLVLSISVLGIYFYKLTKEMDEVEKEKDITFVVGDIKFKLNEDTCGKIEGFSQDISCGEK